MNEFKGFEDMHELDAPDPMAKPEVEVVLFVESCPKCGGSGSWRAGYPCFKCKGTGKLEFKTSAQQRSSGRKSAAKSKVKQAEKTAAEFDQWLIDECPDVAEWLRSNPGNSFTQSLVAGGKKYGHLTEGQVAGVRKAIARDADSTQDFVAWCESHEGVLGWLVSETDKGSEFAGSLLAAGKRFGSLSDGQLNAVLQNLSEGSATDDAVDLTPLVKGYYAVPDGDTRLKIAIRRPGKNSRWHGWTFVDDGAAYGSRRTYGKQAPDGTYAGSIQEQLRAVLANPLEAMKAYGHLTGSCGKCGRILEDEQSVALGIGPICASKM